MHHFVISLTAFYRVYQKLGGLIAIRPKGVPRDQYLSLVRMESSMF
jgi:hypothetical protein